MLYRKAGKETRFLDASRTTGKTRWSRTSSLQPSARWRWSSTRTPERDAESASDRPMPGRHQPRGRGRARALYPGQEIQGREEDQAAVHARMGQRLLRSTRTRPTSRRWRCSCSRPAPASRKRWPSNGSNVDLKRARSSSRRPRSASSARCTFRPAAGRRRQPAEGRGARHLLVSHLLATCGPLGDDNQAGRHQAHDAAQRPPRLRYGHPAQPEDRPQDRGQARRLEVDPALHGDLRARDRRMAEVSAISWTDATFNPWIGCTKVSPACDHCYAERDNSRRGWVPGWGPGIPRKRTKTWGEPLKWNRKAAETGAAPGVLRQPC
jgi:hypothetical protein